MQKTSDRIRLAIVYGGRSGEHEISVRSANSIKLALDPSKYDVSEYLISKQGTWTPATLSPEPGGNPDIDVVFPVLHGTFGEDGTIQGLLELAALPYVGAGVLASAVSMDKVMTKRLCQQARLPVVDYLVVRDGACSREIELPFSYPVFVKPANLGSSVGISRVTQPETLCDAVQQATRFDRTIIIERGITGREFECAVLGGDAPKASVPCEIIPSQEFYTYEDKYLLDRAKIELPPNLAPEKIAEMQRLAVAAFEAVNCECMARVDFLMDAVSGQLFVNEINTIPGFTSISMFPKMWEYSGMPYAKLLDELVALALQRAEVRSRTQYSL